MRKPAGRSDDTDADAYRYVGGHTDEHEHNNDPSELELRPATAAGLMRLVRRVENDRLLQPLLLVLALLVGVAVGAIEAVVGVDEFISMTGEEREVAPMTGGGGVQVLFVAMNSFLSL